MTSNLGTTYTGLCMVDSDELRRELADVAASLRAYLEQHAASGATGIPRGEGRPRSTATTTTAIPTATSTATSTAT